MSFLRNSLLPVLLAACCFCAGAQERDTLIRENLDKSVIVEQMDRPMLLNRQGISGTVNVEKIAAIPSFLGNADPLRFVRLLPSIQLNTELEGGLYMQGSESSMTLVSQQGVPVYGIAHLLGLFSVFNSPHFNGIRYDTSSGQEARLAGALDIRLKDTLARKVGADLSLGLLSAQGTLTLPLGGKSTLTLSGRRTFINTIYGGFLKYGDYPLGYGFTDANLTWLWKPTDRDCVWVDLFGCLDKGHIHAGLIENIAASWYNGLGALHWNHYFPDATLRQRAYFSTYGMEAIAEGFNARGTIPSYLRDFGYRGELLWKNWQFGAHFSHYWIQPQNPRAEGHFSEAGNRGDEPVQHAYETILSAEYKRYLGYWMQVQSGVGLHWYLSPEGRSYFGITPQAGINADLREGGKIEFRYELKRQNIFQLGMTNLGLPNEFWLAAGELQRPQWSHNFTLSHTVAFRDGAFSLSSELYYRKLHHQLEYIGNILDIYTGLYSLANSVVRGKGRAYGANLMLQKHTGRFTGWVSYAWSRSLRTFDNDRQAGEYPSAHERLHELDVVATYDFGRIDVGGTYVLASGAPYTPTTAIHLMGSRIVCEYGEYNSARLPAYSRLDISANWYFRKGPRGKTGLNVSMYNVLGKVNHLGYGLHINNDFTAYSFRTTPVQLRFLPSLAFFHTF